MKIQIPISLREPLMLRWNEMSNVYKGIALIHEIRKALHVLCETGIKAGIIQKTPVNMMIGILQSVAEAAGGEDVWIKFNKFSGRGSIVMIRYTVGFTLPGRPSERCYWQRNIPIE